MNISESDLLGVYFIKSCSPQKISDYFKSVELIRPLIFGKEFIERITGYYLNIIGENSLRLSYCIRNKDPPDNLVFTFLDENEDIFLHKKEEPHKENVS